jgi:DNA-binding transcriptional MerR regulator
MEKFFTIRQVSDVTGLTPHTLRYYEKIRLLKNIHRDENGYRRYSESDLAWIRFLIRLKVTDMPISQMKQFSDLRSRGESTIKARRELLDAHRRSIKDQIRRLQNDLEKIKEKIEHYDGMLEGEN